MTSYNPGPMWLIVSLCEDELWHDRHGRHHLPAHRRPKLLHTDKGEAEQEALRLNELHGGMGRTFIIFEAVSHTETRTPFQVAAQTVSCLVPMEIRAVEIPAKPKRRRAA